MKVSYAYIILIAVLLAGCGPSAEQMTATAVIAKAETQTAAPTLAPTIAPTITPTSTPSATPTPNVVSVYESKSLGIAIKYPTGWQVEEAGDISMRQVTISMNDKHFELFFFPASAQKQNNNDPIVALASYIDFVGYARPDKEMAHLISLDGSESAFGSYNNPGEAPGMFYSENPYFIAMHFTEKYTVAIEFIAPPGDEDENQEIFELVLGSLPPSPTRTVIAQPTMEPNVNGKLPELPQGINWQGVQNIDLALPVPDGWFVKFFNYSEEWQNGLQGYEYQYTITQENPDYVGSFSPVLGILRVYTVKNKRTDASDSARQHYNNLKKSSDITNVIEDKVTGKGDIIVYQIRAEAVNAEIAAGDPGHNQMFVTTLVANKKANVLYVLEFESAAESWDQEWTNGQIMMQALIDFLQQ